MSLLHSKVTLAVVWSLVAIGLVVVLVLGLVQVLGSGDDPAGPSTPGVQETTLPVPGTSVEPLRQMQGQPGEEADCGPVVALMVLRARGVSPDAWDGADPRPAIMTIQGPERMAVTDPEDPTLGTTPGDVERALASYDVDTHRVTSTEEALAAAREGSVLVLQGSTLVFDWPQDIDTEVSHFVMLAGHDSETDEYLIADPISSAAVVHRVSKDDIAAFMDAAPGELGVVA